jgi:hypothetical protein
MPGVRLNFTNRGVSASIGPRGSSVSVSRRGTYLNQSFMGLSRRTKLGGSSAGATSATPAYPVLPPEAEAWWAPHRAWQQAEAARTAEPPPSEKRVATSRLLDACQGGLLRTRVREPLDWEALSASGAYIRRPFVSPVSPDAERQRRAIVNAMVPWTPWAFFAGVLAVLLLLGKVWAGGIALLALSGVRLGLDNRKRQEGIAEFRRADQQLETAAREAHEATEAEREAEHTVRRELAGRVVVAAESGDTAVLAEVLEIELANEDLPLELDFEVAFDGPERVGLDIRLPPLSLVPTTEPTTTPGGKPTTKAIGMRRRAELYRDLCAGLALRLIHETFRVLHLTQEVECVGRGEGRDQATGQPRLVQALEVRISRAAMERLDLDHVDPSTCLEAQGGRIGVAADGTLKAIANGSGVSPS